MKIQDSLFRQVMRRLDKQPGQSTMVREYEAEQTFLEGNPNISRITVSSSGNSRSASFNRVSAKGTVEFLDQFPNMKSIKKG